MPSLMLACCDRDCGSVAAQVKVWQGTLTLPTYEEGKPDPNPPFDTYSTTQFSYPYTLAEEPDREEEGSRLARGVS